MDTAYLDVDVLDFYYGAKQLDELKQCCKFPHVSYLVQHFVLLGWCRWVGSDHLVVCPLSRHDGSGCGSMARGGRRLDCR